MKNLIIFSLLSFFILSCEKKDENSSTQEINTSEIDDTTDFLTKGQEIAMNSQKALGSQLMAKLQEGGPIHALEFCSVEAIPITDSLSKVHNVKISRVSDKNRNPDNEASHAQLDYMDLVKNQLKYGEKPMPLLEPTSKTPKAYYPIVTNAMCLQCHGTPGKEMSEETYAKIQELYPDDKAIGYKDNQLRGIWVIEMMKNTP